MTRKNSSQKTRKAPYWETHEGWDTAGNCFTCGEAGRCNCTHPKKNAPRESVSDHTPTPWKIFDSPYGIGLGKDNSDTQIYYFKTVEEAISKLAEIAPNQIVRVVNSHEELLAACKRALAILTQVDEKDGDRDMLRQAIAKVEGSSLCSEEGK